MFITKANHINNIYNNQINQLTKIEDKLAIPIPSAQFKTLNNKYLNAQLKLINDTLTFSNTINSNAKLYYEVTESTRVFNYMWICSR